jgi:hypothetical protein
MTLFVGRCTSADAIAGKREVKSTPLREVDRNVVAVLVQLDAIAVEFETSCSQRSPFGGRSPSEG